MVCLAGLPQSSKLLPAILQLPVSPAATGAATLHQNTCRSPAHCIEYAKLMLWEHERPGDTFDADEEEHMRWVFDKASTRAQEFGIQVGLAAVSFLGKRMNWTSRAMQLPHTLVHLHPHSVGDPSGLCFPTCNKQQAALPIWSTVHDRPGAAALCAWT